MKYTPIAIVAAITAPLLMAQSCVPNIPLPANITADIATTCAWVPTVKIGVGVAVLFLPAVVADAANGAMTFLSNLCVSPPSDLGGVSAQVINAVQTIEGALTTAKAAMAKPGARMGSGDLAKVNAALNAIQINKRVWHIH